MDHDICWFLLTYVANCWKRGFGKLSVLPCPFISPGGNQSARSNKRGLLCWGVSIVHFEAIIKLVKRVFGKMFVLELVCIGSKSVEIG